VNIYPRETEEALINHPAVSDAAVIGAPSQEWGQEVLAVVSLREGYAPSEALAIELIAFCRDRIAHYKCPRRVQFGELPRTPTGKLLRRKVKKSVRD
jgi:acyl-coenzyme A synthetase/AMP-(fatty) acid ligase